MDNDLCSGVRHFKIMELRRGVMVTPKFLVLVFPVRIGAAQRPVGQKFCLSIGVFPVVKCGRPKNVAVGVIGNTTILTGMQLLGSTPVDRSKRTGLKEVLCFPAKGLPVCRLALLFN